jgi:ABC-type multidrug transport system ATPase subunit
MHERNASTLNLTPPGGDPARTGACVVADRVGRRAGGHRLLDAVSLAIGAGELVAIAGPSGAGKSTLLDVLAGVRRPDDGIVTHDGAVPDVRAGRIGYVPQDDVVHRQLTLRRSLWYTARLRLPAGTDREEVDARVDGVLATLGLGDRAGVVVAALSGGQRKRASVAAELLTSPATLFLDEPTSGLDPASAADLMAHLRSLTGSGVTVVLTTHSFDDLARCDRVVLLARGGVIAYDGPPADAAAAMGADDLVSTYRQLDARRPPATSTTSTSTEPDVGPSCRDELPGPAHAGAVGPHPLVQLGLLARRTAETLVRSRLTFAVLVGSPALVIAMMAILFRPVDGGTGDVAPLQLVFWLAFAGFFFGLTYGLLQIVAEMPLVRREHLAGVDARSYVGAKVLVLVPLLAVVTAALLGVLRVLDRLPEAGTGADLSLYGVLVLEAVAALTLGLAASALVGDATQAVLVLPMVCFPQVLFAGAVVPVAQMTAVGHWISAGMATRWTFESGGRALDVSGSAGAGELAAYGGAFDGATWWRCLILLGLAVACSVGAVAVIRRRCAVR